MAVSYEDALDTLDAMFGSQGWTKTDLGALLRAQAGHMERTCEIILTNEGTPPQVVLANLVNTNDDAALARRLGE